MKNYLAISCFILLSACTTKLNYLGETFSPNPTQIDAFYDVGDVTKDYKVIGKLSGNNQGLRSLNEIKKDMIAEGQRRGADGIIFLHFDSYEENHKVHADLIKYK